MIKPISFIVLTLLFFLFQSCEHMGSKNAIVGGDVSERTEPEPDNNEAVHSCVRYAFDKPITGFWGAAHPGSPKPDYIKETANLSQVVMLGGDNISDIVNKVRKAKQYGKDSVINLQWLLFPWQNLNPYADWTNRFQDLWTQLGEDSSSIVGFYIHDEPYHQNNNNPLQNRIANKWVKNAIDSVASHIKCRTGLPTIITYAPPSVEASIFEELMFEKVDLTGINCYLQFGDQCSKDKITRLVEKIKAASSSFQKLVFTMDGYSTVNTNLTDQELYNRNRFWLRLMGDNSSLVGAVLPFVYQNIRDNNMLGFESYPQAMEVATIAMGAYSEKFSCLGDDLYLFGEPYWKKAPYCVPSCEGSHLVRRNARGQVINIWHNAPLCNNP